MSIYNDEYGKGQFALSSNGKAPRAPDSLPVAGNLKDRLVAEQMKMKKVVLTAICATLVAGLVGCKGAKPIYLEADADQIGAGAILFLVDPTGTGTLMMKATPDHPQGVLEDVKLTEKVDMLTAPVWTLVTDDTKKSLVFAPSAAGWICQSCADYKLPSKWHIKARSN